MCVSGTTASRFPTKRWPSACPLHRALAPPDNHASKKTTKEEREEKKTTEEEEEEEDEKKNEEEEEETKEESDLLLPAGRLHADRQAVRDDHHLPLLLLPLLLLLLLACPRLRREKTALRDTNPNQGRAPSPLHDAIDTHTHTHLFYT